MTAKSGSVWSRFLTRRNFQFKLSLAIPLIVTFLVTITGLVINYFTGKIFSSMSIDPKEFLRVQQMLQMMTIAYLMSVGFAFVVASLVTYAITRPIQRLVMKARAIGSGDLAYSLDVEAYDEFGVLERTFNEMAKALKDYRDQLEEYNKTLERRVEERTAELSAVLGLTKSLIFILDTERLIKLVMSKLREVTRCDLCGFLTIGEEALQLTVGGRGEVTQAAAEAFGRQLLAVAGQAANRSLDAGSLTVRVEEAAGADPSLVIHQAPAAVVSAPLIVGSQVTGAVAIGAMRQGVLDENAQKLVTIVANHAAMALENTKSYSRLKELDRLKSEFVSTVSHELRTPLTSIREGLDLLGEGAFGGLNEKQQELVTIVSRNSERLYVIINDLLDLSKLEAGEVTFRKREVDLRRLVRETTESIALQTQQKGIIIERRCADDVPPVYADPDKMTQVLTNLLGNAAKFTPQGGRIVVAAQREEAMVRTTVFNSGAPIPSTELERIFDKFYQVGRTPGPGAKGTGLGLAIVREIVQRHGGRVWAESVAEGNSFHVTLPVLDRAAAFADSIQEMIEKAQSRRSFFSMVVIRVAGLDRVEAAVAERALDEVRMVLDEAVRADGSADIVSRCGNEPAAAILAMTDRDGAEAIRGRALEALQQRRIGEALQIGPLEFGSHLVVYPKDGMTKELLLKRAQGFAN